MMKKLLPIILFFIAMPCSATITLNNVTAQHTTFPNTRTVTTSTGNGPYIIMMTVNPGSTLSTCADNKSDTYILHVTHSTDATSGNAYVCYALIGTKGVTTVSFTGTGAGAGSFQFYDCSSISPAFDTIINLDTQNSANPAPGITAAASGIAVAAAALSHAATAVASPFTLDTADLAGYGGFAGFSHDVNGAGGSLTSTFTVATGTWSSIIATFKESGVGIGGGLGGKAGMGGLGGIG